MGDTAWEKQEGEGAAIVDAAMSWADPKQASAIAKNIGQAWRVGQEDLDGILTLVYQYQMGVPEAGVISIPKVWVGLSDHLPRKLESNTTITTSEQTVSGQLTAMYYDYNTDVKIEPPIP
ncbi:MAG TPA: hypothetical protein VJG32_13710 [Anaerolineae bacterium]|nr:hypothetical protein [Anaerolineae bacterium]